MTLHFKISVINEESAYCIANAGGSASSESLGFRNLRVSERHSASGGRAVPEDMSDNTSICIEDAG